MNIDLVSSPRDIQKKWDEVGHPLGFLLSINVFNHASWRFSFRFSEGDRVDLRIASGQSVDLSQLLNGFFPKLLNCERALVSLTGENSNLEFSPRRHIEENPSDLRMTGVCVDSVIDSGIEFQNIFPNRFFPEYTNRRQIENFLLLNTWMGSVFLTPDKYSVTLSAAQNSICISNSPRTGLYCDGVREDEPVYLSRKIDMDAGLSAQGYSNSSIGKVHLVSMFGECFSPTSKPVKQILKGCADIPAGYFELASDKIVYSGCQESDCLEDPEVVVSLLRSTVLDSKYQAYLNEVELYKRQREVTLLNERKERLQRSLFVYFRNELMFKKPTSEIEVVILHSKLEALGALPYSAYTSLEYTPKLGIDAISDFKVRANDQMHKFATVEYEYKFSSYFRHGHAIEQTDLVICWTIDSLPKGSLKNLDDDWIYEFEEAGERMLVGVIEKYPEIEIRDLL